MKALPSVLFLLVSCLCVAQGKVTMTINDDSISCDSLQQQQLSFLIDGSLQDESVVRREIAKLESCGLDDYDVRFFGRLDALSGMLKRLTRDQLVEQLTYGDLLEAINNMKETGRYQELKKISRLSQRLATTMASINTWEQDVLMFQELGASQQIIDKVYRYLRENPETDLSYEQLLIKLKK
jgi:hypothetical protein